LDVTYQYCNIWHHGVLCYYVSYDSFITSSMQNKKIINENCWCGRHISLPHHISVKHFRLMEITGVAKLYPCHTTFQTDVAATPATPLPAPLPQTRRTCHMLQRYSISPNFYVSFHSLSGALMKHFTLSKLHRLSRPVQYSPVYSPPNVLYYSKLTINSFTVSSLLRNLNFNSEMNFLRIYK